MLIHDRLSRVIRFAESGQIRQAEELLQSIIEHHLIGDVKPSSELRRLVTYLEQRYGLTVQKDSQKLAAGASRNFSLNGQVSDKNGSHLYLVTPTLNSSTTLNRTIQSVVGQQGDFILHYHIQDGGSSDETLEIIQRWSRALENSPNPSVKLSYAVHPDKGMYDAICQGFLRILPREDVWMGWINSDDTLFPGTLQFLVDITGAFGDGVRWIAGLRARLGADGEKIMQYIPYASEIISQGLCDGCHWWFLQQEGTFWRKRIWDTIDTQQGFQRFRFAGDWNLWREFARSGEILFQARMPLGLFHYREDQLSQKHFNDYLREIDAVISLSERKKALENLKTNTMAIHNIEKIHNLDVNALLYSSSLIQIIGAKECYPEIQPVKILG